MYLQKIILPLLLLLCANGIGQGIYEIKYKFTNHSVKGPLTDQVEYHALAFYYDQNSPNNKMRIRYYDAKYGWVVVEQKIKSSVQKKDGKDYWVLDGEAPVFISKVDQDYEYSPDFIILSKEPQEQYYTPDYAYSPFEDGSYGTGEISSFRALDKSTITNAYLNQFLWEWPADNGQIKLGNTNLYLVLISNTNDASLGNGFAANHRKLKSLFKDAAMSAGVTFHPIEVSGNDFSIDNVNKTISGLNTTTNDIIIFYYSGHGFRYTDQESPWPRMDLREGVFQTPDNTNSLNIGTDVYTQLSKKEHQLLLVFGECCNVFQGNTPFISEPILMAPGGNVMNSNVIKTLFSKKGELLVATSSKGEPSFYDGTSGGYFCTTFINDLMNMASITNSSDDASWEKLIKNAIDNTAKKSSGDNFPQNQTPIYLNSIK